MVALFLAFVSTTSRSQLLNAHIHRRMDENWISRVEHSREHGNLQANVALLVLVHISRSWLRTSVGRHANLEVLRPVSGNIAAEVLLFSQC